ncbi:MAG: fumarylacetoacetate hydrolase family protein [Advenella sp.]|uniref:Fumarylacetoacetase-like C-terminal domain-containing protein n=1 Tax=Advenella kashmirensis TaxID=310575 RepID=A0A356LC78_9BURK|nr:fumarylacetoacetate hydrolase family protein [Advenella sp. FME57]HBP28552.1 hypothetical protein [Advenella kashmirensis]
MKFLIFIDYGQPRLGLLLGDNKVIALAELLGLFPDHGLAKIPTCINELIMLGDKGTDIIQNCLNKGVPDIQMRLLDDVQVLPPLKMTKNVFCVGRNYRDHIIEGNLARGRPADAFPEAIEFFSKPPTAVVGHRANVCRYAKLTDTLDYEVELAIVIGTRGKNISRNDALKHVFGYTIVNDITARNLQQLHGQWLKGKSLDTTCPMGPVVVHHSAIDNANNLDVSLTLNGELRQSDNTSSMIFSIEAIIEQLSAGMTLEPGDVIATGTPKGVGFAMTPPSCLKTGDVVSASVQHVGTLTNTISD